MKTKLLIAVGIGMFIIQSCSSDSKPTLTDAQLEAMAEEAYEAKISELEHESMKPEFEWQYTEEIDEMTSAKKTLAQCTSPDVVNFDFPYEGGSYLSLYLRKNDKGDSDAFIYISKGQFTSESITVRFDDDEPIQYFVNNSADGNSQYQFIAKTKDFTNKISKAKKVKIQCMFYNNGNHVFNFDMKGFKF